MWILSYASYLAMMSLISNDNMDTIFYRNRWADLLVCPWLTKVDPFCIFAFYSRFLNTFSVPLFSSWEVRFECVPSKTQLPPIWQSRDCSLWEVVYEGPSFVGGSRALGEEASYKVQLACSSRLCPLSFTVWGGSKQSCTRLALDRCCWHINFRLPNPPKPWQIRF